MLKAILYRKETLKYNFLKNYGVDIIINITGLNCFLKRLYEGVPAFGQRHHERLPTKQKSRKKNKQNIRTFTHTSATHPKSKYTATKYYTLDMYEYIEHSANDRIMKDKKEN